MDTIRSEIQAWLGSLDQRSRLTVTRQGSRRIWLNDPTHLPQSTRVYDPRYRQTEVQFVTERRAGGPEVERPLIVCNLPIHSNMYGLVSPHEDDLYVLVMAKTEAGSVVHRAMHPGLHQKWEDPYASDWAITCAHQFSMNTSAPLRWLTDAEGRAAHDATLLDEVLVGADGGMLAKKYWLGLVSCPEEQCESIVREVRDTAMGDVCRWLTPTEIRAIARLGRACEFVFTTLGLLCA